MLKNFDVRPSRSETLEGLQPYKKTALFSLPTSHSLDCAKLHAITAKAGKKMRSKYNIQTYFPKTVILFSSRPKCVLDCIGGNRNVKFDAGTDLAHIWN